MNRSKGSRPEEQNKLQKQRQKSRPGNNLALAPSKVDAPQAFRTTTGPQAVAMKPADVLSLQRTVGNKAVSRMLADRRAAAAIQRYSEINPDNYTTEAGAAFPTQGYQRDPNRPYQRGYTAESKDISAPGAKTVDFQKTLGASEVAAEAGGSGNKAAPNLKYSATADKAMALELTADEPRVFYATANMIDESNAALEAKNASARIEQAGGSIKVPKRVTSPEADGDHTLLMVKPAGTKREEESGRYRLVDTVGSAATSECNSVVSNILGKSVTGSRAAVLAGGAEIPAPGGKEPTRQIAEHAMKEDGAAADLAATLGERGAPESRNTTLPEAYLGKSEEDRRASSQRLGIDEFARPEVGEGYVTQSSWGNQDPTAGFTVDEFREALAQLDTVDVKKIHEGGALNGLRATKEWVYHYAGVVAALNDDTVTMENYNRGQVRTWEIDEMFTQLFQEEEAFRSFVHERLADEQKKIPAGATDRAKQWQRFGIEWKTHRSEINREAGETRDRIDQIVTQIDASIENLKGAVDKKAHFKMYGPGEQSFHAQWKGAAINPMTLRVRESFNVARDGISRNLVDFSSNLLNLMANVSSYDITIPASADLMGYVQTISLSAEVLHGVPVNSAEEFNAIQGEYKERMENVRRLLITRLLAAAATLAGQPAPEETDDREQAAAQVAEWNEALTPPSIRITAGQKERANQVEATKRKLSQLQTIFSQVPRVP